MKAFVDQVSAPPTKIMVLGPSFTSQAKVIAEVAPFYNLVEVRRPQVVVKSEPLEVRKPSIVTFLQENATAEEKCSSAELWGEDGFKIVHQNHATPLYEYICFVLSCA